MLMINTIFVTDFLTDSDSDSDSDSVRFLKRFGFGGL